VLLSCIRLRIKSAAELTRFLVRPEDFKDDQGSMKSLWR
jgi:hypothetical protein